MLSKKEIASIREELLNCQTPIFFFDDDPDGLASFLLLYRFVQEGKGFIVKTKPSITESFVQKVENYGADKVFILDIASVDQEFLDNVKVPVIWIDHHEPLQRDKVKYFNPRRTVDKNVPTSALCWQVVEQDRPQDLWIALVGCVGDWFMPEFAAAFRQASPDILPHTGDVADILFNSTMGLLVKIFSFNLKGASAEVLKSMKTFTRVETPYELLNQSTSKGRFLWKRYLAANKIYEQMLKTALKQKPKKGILIFTYDDDRLSLTKDLSNELLYRSGCVVIVARDRMGTMRCSLRSPEKYDLASAVANALKGIEGYGGGHKNACGACINKDDFEQFVDNLRKELGLTL
ncbi:DHH family phosphoesterase [Candidatus Woesearchaeota archaeon]|nr:DHH family phosphoesterase [Candidatus Woesearchaeota archaeon]